MTPTDWQYNITQVSEITGLSKQVIRKWEERYQLVHPKRLENGHRVYSEEDVQLYLKVLSLSNQGYSIKQAVTIVLSNQNVLEAVTPTVLTISDNVDHFCNLLLEEGRLCNEVELNRLLQQANHSLGLAKFLSHVIIPFLQEVGRLWEKQEWTEYQESVTTMIVRDYLVQLRRNYHSKEDAPLIMGACLPGEHHEVQLHILLLQAMMTGWRSFLVGSSPAVGAIESLIIHFKPKVVLLSAMTTRPFELYPTSIQQLDDFAAKHPAIRFYMGGAGSEEYLKTHSLHSIAIASTIDEVINNSHSK
ncbi:MerR family transcriptional regulator [Lysinibacillus capsici]|uniref:MerR family transcriptional regulator n=1 Tax=Lysinibacillus capsici TaxID=2115968 RepID=UPI003D013A9A